jgi:glycosyltransferase involved in cell wall biosynthesis
MMRIGVIHWGFIPRGGGVEAHLLTVYPEAVKQGAEVFLLTEAYSGFPEEETVNGIKVVRNEGMSAPKIDERKKAGEDLYPGAYEMFADFVEKYQIEAVQAHNLHMGFYSLSKALNDVCRERNISCCLVIHNHEFIDRDYEIMKRILKDLPWTKLIPISRFISKELQRNIPEIPKNKYQVIMHGIDLDIFMPRSIEEKEKLKDKYGLKGSRVILHPARMLRWKGIVPAIKAMPSVIKKFPDVKLVLTGKVSAIVKEQKDVKEYYALVDETIEKLGVKENVHIGNYRFSDIPDLTALADVSIYTTIGDEPFGLCPVEAMACGVPAIVTSSGGLVESVVDNDSGFIIPKEEDKIPAELSDRLIRIFSDPDMAANMGKAGRKRAEEKFDKKRMAEELIDLKKKNG